MNGGFGSGRGAAPGSGLRGTKVVGSSAIDGKSYLRQTWPQEEPRAAEHMGPVINVFCNSH